MVNTSAAAKPIQLSLAGAKQLKKMGKTFVIGSAELKAENSLAEPVKLAPVEKSIRVPSNDFSVTLSPNSLTVLRVGAATK